MEVDEGIKDETLPVLPEASDKDIEPSDTKEITYMMTGIRQTSDHPIKATDTSTRTPSESHTLSIKKLNKDVDILGTRVGVVEEYTGLINGEEFTHVPQDIDSSLSTPTDSEDNNTLPTISADNNPDPNALTKENIVNFM